MTFLEILSILCLTFTLSTLRDDFTALQHRRDQIQRLENRYASDRVGQGSTIATLYWDNFGEIKAVFNMGINPELVDILQRSGANLAQAVQAECQQWFQRGAVSLFLTGARWGSQLGFHWRNILHRPSGVATVAITIELQARFSSPPDMVIVLGQLRKWFEQGGNSVLVLQVPRALTAGNTPGNSREESIIAKGPGFGRCSILQGTDPELAVYVPGRTTGWPFERGDQMSNLRDRSMGMIVIESIRLMRGYRIDYPI